jgi:hypothetical protein
MAALTYSKKLFIERILRDLLNDFPDADRKLSNNEVLLHIDQAVAFAMVGSIYNAAKLEGTLTMPEAYLSTYSLGTLSKNEANGQPACRSRRCRCPWATV